MCVSRYQKSLKSNQSCCNKFLAGKQEIGDARKNRRSLTQREYDMEEDYKKTMKKLGLEKGMEYDIVRIPRDPGENHDE